VVVAQLSQAGVLAANYTFALSRRWWRWRGFAKLWLGFSRRGAVLSSCGWVLAAVEQRRQAVAGRLLTPAEAGCKLVGHPHPARLRLTTGCAAKIKFS